MRGRSDEYNNPKPAASERGELFLGTHILEGVQQHGDGARFIEAVWWRGWRAL